jgi:hypothetical protein
MEIYTINGTALRSGFVAPALGGALAGVCPQAGFRRVDSHAVNLIQATVPTSGFAGMVTGPRTWSPPIT